MKCLSYYLFFLFSFNAIAENCHSVKEDLFDQLQKQVESILRSSDLKMPNKCSSIENSIYSLSIDNARKKSKSLLSEVDVQLKKIKRGSKTYRSLKKIRKTLNCISNIPKNKITFSCNFECRGNMMKVERVENRFLGVTTSIETKKHINICSETIFRLNSMNRLSVESAIFHELSHMCGANDYVYLSGVKDEPTNWSVRGKRKAKKWHNNADHYRYWYLFGFCVPDINCPSEYLVTRLDRRKAIVEPMRDENGNIIFGSIGVPLDSK